MNPIDLLTDAYDRKARLYPAIFLLSPALVGFVLIATPKLSVFNSTVAAIASLGGLFLLSQIGRGRSKEPQLFHRWGGMPSVIVLRHSDKSVDPYTKARYHRLLSALVPDAEPPSPEKENSDPSAADEVYTAWSSFLRVNTRDVKKHPLIFKENINYGYCRNLWALKAWGIVVSSAVALGCVAFAWFSHLKGILPNLALIGTFGFSVLAMLLWIFRFTPSWVRSAADAYALRLTESVDLLSSTKTAKPSTKRAKKSSKAIPE
jgi:hypothetical protein